MKNIELENISDVMKGKGKLKIKPKAKWNLNLLFDPDALVT